MAVIIVFVYLDQYCGYQNSKGAHGLGLSIVGDLCFIGDFCDDLPNVSDCARVLLKGIWIAIRIQFIWCQEVEVSWCCRRLHF